MDIPQMVLDLTLEAIPITISRSQLRDIVHVRTAFANHAEAMSARRTYHTRYERKTQCGTGTLPFAHHFSTPFPADCAGGGRAAPLATPGARLEAARLLAKKSSAAGGAMPSRYSWRGAV